MIDKISIDINEKYFRIFDFFSIKANNNYKQNDIQKCFQRNCSQLKYLYIFYCYHVFTIGLGESL